VWTYAPTALQVTVHMARWDGTAWVDEPSLTGPASAEGYLHIEPDGLSPDTTYAVQSEVDGTFSAVAQARTAPALDARVEVRFGGISCLDQLHGEFPALDALQSLGPIDAMLWLGDTIYADGLSTEAGYRNLWQTQLAKGSMQRMFQSAPGIFIWDDHEVTNNWDPQSIPAQHLDMAVKTFFETVPFPSTVRQTRRLWRSQRWGETVEVFVLDVRSERDRAAGQYISPEQLAWLKEGLSNSECVWKVVATTVPITDWPLAWNIADAQTDRWDGYEGTQRAEILSHIRQGALSGVFFVSGDLHQTTLSYVDPEGLDGDDLLEFLVGPGGSFLNTPARLLRDDPQFPYADADWSAGRMVFRPDGTAQLQTVHEHGALMLDATIDVAGGLTITTAMHPWEDA
jgi:phosphodiesterase/alkaline phosphatase D-like protein